MTSVSSGSKSKSSRSKSGFGLRLTSNVSRFGRLDFSFRTSFKNVRQLRRQLHAQHVRQGPLQRLDVRGIGFLQNNRFYDITVLRYFFVMGTKFSVLEQDFPTLFSEMSK